jgi:hypothetical protein
MRRSGCLAGAVLAIALAGCGQPGSVRATPALASGSPAVAATASPGDPAAWQRAGATEVPPASVRDVALGAVQVVDDTNGAVSDADARRWAVAYLRANAYEFWAWNHLQDSFLLHAGLSQVPTRVFAYDITTIGEARKAGVQLQVTRLALRRLVLRPVPDALRQEFTKQIFAWTPYAFYLDQVGPSELSWIDAQGTRTVRARKDPGVGAPELVGGQLATDPLMGEVWVADSDWDCTSPNVRLSFGTLCSQ